MTNRSLLPPAPRAAGPWSVKQPNRRYSERTDRSAATIDRTALFAEFMPLVRRLMRQFGDDAESRKDLAGEIFCQFNALLEAFDPERGVPLRPYLVTQLSAAIYSYTRKRWRNQRRELSYEEHAEYLTGGTDPTPGWDAALQMRSLRDALPAAIRELPPRQRSVVIWRYYESRSFDEIGEMLGVQASTARSLLRHGLNGIRKRVAVHPEGDPDNRYSDVA